ncbi:MAG: immunoglobulin-like domain-containing protein [Treponema sp.]
MKVLMKIAAASFIAAALSIVSCNTAASPSDDGNHETQQQKTDKADVENAAKALSLPQVVLKGEHSITLPATGGGVSISWKSGNPSVISETGAVTHPAGSGTTEVTLTATLTKGEATATQTFTVKVHQKDRVPTTKEILQSVSITFTYNETTFKDQEVPFESTKTVDGKSISISYQSNDEKHLKVDNSAHKITVHRDIVDVSVKLTVTLTCESETDTRELTVPVKRIPSFKRTTKYGSGSTTEKTVTTITFDGNTVTKKTEERYTDTDGKYTFTADTAAGMMTVTRTASWLNGKLLTKDDWIKEAVKQQLDIFAALKNAYSEPTLTNMRDAWNLLKRTNFATEDEFIEKVILTRTSIRQYFDATMGITTVEEFKALSDDKIKAGVKKYAEKEIKDQGHFFVGDTSSLTVDEILTKAQEKLPADARRYANGLFGTSATYKYEVKTMSGTTEPTYENEVWFEARGIYDKSKGWYEQNGRWNGLYEAENNKWTLRDEVNKCSYTGMFNDQHTEFSYTQKQNDSESTPTTETGKWTLGAPNTDATPITMTATNNGTTITLTFYGNQF